MVNQRPLFPGDSEIDELFEIFRFLWHLDVNPHVPDVLAAILSCVGTARDILPLLEEPISCCCLAPEAKIMHRGPVCEDVGEIAKASQTKASSLPNQAEMFSAHVSSKILVLQKWINENHVDNSSFSVTREVRRGGMALILCQRLLLGGESIIASLTVPLMVKSENLRKVIKVRLHARQRRIGKPQLQISRVRQRTWGKWVAEMRTKSRNRLWLGPSQLHPHQSAWSCDEGFERVYHNLASFRAVGASVSSANQIKFLITKLKDEVHSDHMNVSGSRESIIEFPTVELEDEGGRNEEPSVVADACNVELYQYVPEGEFSIEDMQRIMGVDIENRNELALRSVALLAKKSPNLLQCGRNNHDGYEKSVLRNPSSTEKALSIIDGSNPKTGSSKPSTTESSCCGCD
ncbi:TELO2 interacting protein 1 [Musa troglodytarum]|uniref:TELO2 interacting protein 1 n=1 Tax=Musa troglodytarum TaxID=320322 RepID=A0A9E7JED2_9LILI|nr:TELO2 interacting protein 1 [Musa troglodytarum]